MLRICVKRVSDPTYGIEKAEEKPKENGPDDISSAPYDRKILTRLAKLRKLPDYFVLYS